MSAVSLFWFRRDLRLEDNTGLYHALKAGRPVVPIFIFDTEILDKLEDRDDARVTFIHQALGDIQARLEALGSTLHVEYGSPAEVWPRLLAQYQVQAVYTNHDYEPYALQRDEAIRALLAERGIALHTYKDQVIFEKDEVLSATGKPYTVFTPYSKAWKTKASDPTFFRSHPSEQLLENLHRQAPRPLPSLEAMNFQPSTLPMPGKEVSDKLLANYAEKRNFPAVPGTSRLSVHLRFGTLSIRELARRGQAQSDTWLNELIWRDFYHQFLWHNPGVAQKAFKPAYDQIQWENKESDFQRWCAGQTGYPLVDAGMRELAATGFMHNRVRMVVASFLCKHLLIDWRWGEAWFARKLLDFDLAANNGGWQWASGSGCDAAPYFRIFNPALQMDKFDKQRAYIKKWVPELWQGTYVAPIVEHEFARKRCLERYQAALKPAGEISPEE